MEAGGYVPTVGSDGATVVLLGTKDRGSSLLVAEIPPRFGGPVLSRTPNGSEIIRTGPEVWWRRELPQATFVAWGRPEAEIMTLVDEIHVASDGAPGGYRHLGRRRDQAQLVTFVVRAGDRQGLVVGAQLPPSALLVLQAMVLANDPQPATTTLLFYGQEALLRPTRVDLEGHRAVVGQVETSNLVVAQGDPGLALFTEPRARGNLNRDDRLTLARHLRRATAEEVERGAR